MAGVTTYVGEVNCSPANTPDCKPPLQGMEFYQFREGAAATEGWKLLQEVEEAAASLRNLCTRVHVYADKLESEAEEGTPYSIVTSPSLCAMRGMQDLQSGIQALRRAVNPTITF